MQKGSRMYKLGEKKLFGTAISNRILWILPAWFFHFFVIGAFFFTIPFRLFYESVLPLDSMSDAVFFVFDSYLTSFLPLFIYALLYTAITRKNRFIFRSFLPGERSNKISKLLKGFLEGFLTNAFCVVVALIFGDIKLSLSFGIRDIPFYLFAFASVLIQSATEELWNRGILMERVHVHYPMWLAMVLNSSVFAALHLANPGISALPVINLFIAGLVFSVISWQSDSIWYPIGAHTAWNFTQNLLFGLPNSGLVSKVSIFRLEAANANDPLVYDPEFGVEGSLPATFINLAATALFLYFAYKQGRLNELLLSKEKAAGLTQDAEPAPEVGGIE